MGSGITFSGFNNIDFNLVLNSIMQQESQPLRALQDQQSVLKSKVTTFTQLGARTTALRDAASALATVDAVSAFRATSTNGAAVGVTAGAGATAGRYDIIVNELARAQVTASVSTTPDADTTIVADGGTLTIGGETITLSGPVTLSQLAAAINGATDSPARASVVQSAPGSFRLVLTGKSSGEANAFTVANGLSGGAGVTFTDTNGNGVTGDSVEDNAVQASNARILVNNIEVTSASNTLDSVIPGTTVTLYQSDPATTIVIDIEADSSALQAKLEAFVAAYNDLVAFSNDQTSAAGRGDQSSIGRDPVLRQLRGELRGALTSGYPNSGPLQTLAELGVELQRDGTLSLNQARFSEAIAGGTDHVAALLTGTTAAPGALATVKTMLGQYTDSAGILTAAKTQLNERSSRLSDQIGKMEDRLALRRLALQREFTAADQAMSLLKSQSDSLASFGSNF